LGLRNYAPKLSPFVPDVPSHHESQIGDEQPGSDGIEERFIDESAETFAVIKIFTQELFDLGGIHAFHCGSFYARPSLSNSKRREVNREIIQASLGDIGGEQPLSLTPGSRLHEPSDLSLGIRLIYVFGTVPICDQIIPL
jgi:hypothetical protein